MGTDIHGHLQTRSSPRGDWKTVAKLPDKRNYQRFWTLAGVRYGEGEPISEPRGLPPSLGYYDFDLLDTGNRKVQSSVFDDHSQSWLFVDEILASEQKEYLGQDFLDWLTVCKKVYGWYGEDELRIVFGFDS